MFDNNFGVNRITEIFLDNPRYTPYAPYTLHPTPHAARRTRPCARSCGGGTRTRTVRTRCCATVRLLVDKAAELRNARAAVETRTQEAPYVVGKAVKFQAAVDDWAHPVGCRVRNFEVWIPIKRTHNSSVHSRQPSVAGEESGKVREEASQVWICCVSLLLNGHVMYLLSLLHRYTEQEVARRLLSQGYVMVGHAKVAVKEMDGQPAIFNN